MIGGTIQWTPKENIMTIVKHLDPTFTSEKSEDILELVQKAEPEDLLKVICSKLVFLQTFFNACIILI